MQYVKGLMLSTSVALFATGCVKPTEQVNTTAATTTNGTQVYTGETASTGTYTPVYEDSSTIVYEDPATTGSGTVYGSTTTSDGSVITTDGYETPASSTAVSGGGAYGNPYGSTTTTTTPAYNDPYAVGSTETNTYSYDDPYTSSSSASDYTTNTSYDTTGYTGGGIQLQVAALRDYAAAEEFKNSLSLDPKYSAYVKRGAMNKVIITGIATRAEAKRLASSRFPGAFIVGGSEMSGGSSYTSSTSSYSGSSAAAVGNGIGVQVGAFSSKASARAAAENAAGGRYTAIVKTAKVRGRTIYKAIILGFASKQAARSAIASGQFGDAFVVSNIH